jgi:hypothetical protein
MLGYMLASWLIHFEYSIICLICILGFCSCSNASLSTYKIVCNYNQTITTFKYPTRKGQKKRIEKKN